MILERLVVGPLQCNCTIVGDEQSREAIVVDGGDGVPQVVAKLRELQLRANYLVHTHAHIDHIGDVATLRSQTKAMALLHPADLPLYQTLPLQAQWIGYERAPEMVELDGDLGDGDRLRAGNIEMLVLHTPGHTPGSVCLQFEHDKGVVILSGDTLFAGSIGRWDIGGTSMEDIVHSIQTKLLTYPDESAVIPGHGPSTTIGTERRSNPYLVAARG